MSHEFELHNLVSQLVSLVRAPSTVDVDEQVQILSKNRTPYITTQVSAHNAKRKIVEFSSQGEEFLRKYDELKLRQARNLDPLVYLLSKMTEDVGLMAYLYQIRGPPEISAREDKSDVKVLDLVEGQEVQLPEQGAVLTEEELEAVKGKLDNFTSTLQDREKAKLKETKVVVGFPWLPSWLNDRTYLSGDFCEVDFQKPGGVSLGTLPIALQENAIIQDFLYLMNGVSGRYIRSQPLPLVPKDGVGGTFAGHRTFKVDPSLDHTLHSLVNRLLPLPKNYSTVAGFLQDMNTFAQGMVNQALAGAMRGVVKEYFVYSAQLEAELHRGQLTLQKMWYHLQPCLSMMALLARIATAIGKGQCRGGKTLSTLHKLTGGYSGDTRSQQLCLHLTTAACVPYFEMLGNWVFQGEVHDPYGEFMVLEQEQVAKDRLRVEYNDAYWETRYTLCQENIPSFLEQLAEKVLRAGKYLNVMCECGRSVDYTGPRQLSYQQDEGGYTDTIHEAYSFASKSLLSLVMDEEDLLGHLRSIKHYFLIDQGDLLVHFMDMAQEELAKPVSEILPQRIESLLELALRTSLADHDPYKDNVCTKLWHFDLVSQLLFIIAIQPQSVGVGVDPPPPVVRPDSNTRGLSGVEAFCLDYKVKWPLSLVISRKCLYRYQMLFRHLFFCRHVERELCATWTDCKSAKASALDCNSWYPSAFALLQRMLNYVQNLQYFITCEVLEPLWAELEKSLRSATTIDDVLVRHNDFLDMCLKDCMLSNREVLKITSRLLGICIVFTRHVQQARGHKLPHPSIKSGRARLLSEDGGSGNIAEMVASCEDKFRKELVRLLDLLYNTGTQDVRGMVARLDFNGFYQDLYMPTNSVTSLTTR